MLWKHDEGNYDVDYRCGGEARRRLYVAFDSSWLYAVSDVLSWPEPHVYLTCVVLFEVVSSVSGRIEDSRRHLQMSRYIDFQR